MTQKISAIIPVRGGSVRLPNKNILPFGDSNLLIHKINQLKKVEQLTEIVVSSDDDKMLEMAKNEGCKTHKRTIEYADEITKSFGEVVAHVVECATDCDNVMWTPCVCPLVTSTIYTEAIEKYLDIVVDKKEYDSLISSKLFKEFLWDEEGPVNYKLGLGHVPSQQLPNWETIINGFYLAPREDMIKWSYFFGLKPYRMIIDSDFAIDIDYEIDYEFAKFMYKKMNGAN